MPTGIEWTDETWNPTVGCSKVSPGCDHCYAAGVAHRAMQPAHHGLTIRPSGGGIDWTGQVRCLPDRLGQPLARRPRRIFVGSMSDLFHPQVSDEFIARTFGVMALAERHSFQLLTKRPQRMARTLARVRSWPEPCTFREAMAAEWWRHDPDLGFATGWPLPNVWAGTSIESQRWADLRLQHLIDTPAAIRWVSIEPLLGPIDLARTVCEADQDRRDAGIGRGLSRRYAHAAGCCTSALARHLDWVVVGGESGPGARPMHPDWVRHLRDQCTAAGVAFFFKQWGTWVPTDGSGGDFATVGRGGVGPIMAEPGTSQLEPWVPGWKGGKHATGRVLDGRTWEQFPAPNSEAVA